MLSSTVTRPLQLLTRVMQWSSAVIVMGITSYFIHKGPRGLSIKYQEIIAVMSVVFFLPAFVSPFMPTALSKFVLLIDVVFSYLWLTAFIFAAQDYNRHNCFYRAPPGISCSKKKANEAFIFLTFIFTFIGMFLEVLGLWAYRREHAPVREKTAGAHGGPADAPVATA
ncbi:membrane-associating domain-containing protein [Aspergillus coremiiformis]|uniref:Membrane-associating domain-containing protein n=1 Tax=Aspergillus coremiiformis TaxID=138285 RepID=A0A5N6Z9N3_9EURO|nr:membrane-associating domain-containing protein [Aspergillus coremiiformis]